MISKKRHAFGLDVIGLFLAGLINTFLALPVAAVVLGPGTIALQSDLPTRVIWIAEHTARWQAGWLFWFAVTLSFAWSYFAIGRHLRSVLPWPMLAIGIAIIAASIDLVGVLVNLTVLPELSRSIVNNPANQAQLLQEFFGPMEYLANTLTNVAAFGLYSFAGLLLLPSLFSTPHYSRWLIWLGVIEWSIAIIATILLIIAPKYATGPLLLSFALYAPWVWGSAIWLLRKETSD